MRNVPFLTVAMILSLSPPGDAGPLHNRAQDRGSWSASDLGGSFSNSGGPGSGIAFKRWGVFEITLDDVGTGWQEQFLVGLPKAPLVPAPVLVVFHGYGGTPDEILEDTTYFEQAMARGWIVVAPLGAHQYNFGIDYSQTNVEKALEWVARWLVIDVDRFYGVGFSMGGGAVTSYASRHLDPFHARFAAVVNHTGTTSIRDSYWNSNDKQLLESPLMFGGSPDAEPFRYQTASTIDLDTFSGLIDPDSDMARNLVHVPAKGFDARFDPLWYLVHQTFRLHDHLIDLGGASIYSESGDSIHDWGTLAEKDVLDFFEPITYSEPGPGTLTRILADRDGRWLDFRIQQAQTGQFSPFRWTVVPTINRVVVDEVENVARMTIFRRALGLKRKKPLEVVFDSADDQPLVIVVYGYKQAPSDVKRNGTSSGAWTHDPVARTVSLFESGQGSYPKWTIIP